MTIDIGNHNGDVIHNQDQFATLPVSVNFNIKNIRNNKVPNPIPPDALLFDIILLF